jgi:hypothetical protein
VYKREAVINIDRVGAEVALNRHDFGKHTKRIIKILDKRDCSVSVAGYGQVCKNRIAARKQFIHICQSYRELRICVVYDTRKPGIVQYDCASYRTYALPKNLHRNFDAFWV